MKIRTPKPRNPKEIRSPKLEIIFALDSASSDFGVRHSFGFRISEFGFYLPEVFS